MRTLIYFEVWNWVKFRVILGLNKNLAHKLAQVNMTKIIE